MSAKNQIRLTNNIYLEWPLQGSEELLQIFVKCHKFPDSTRSSRDWILPCRFSLAVHTNTGKNLKDERIPNKILIDLPNYISGSKHWVSWSSFSDLALSITTLLSMRSTLCFLSCLWNHLIRSRIPHIIPPIQRNDTKLKDLNFPTKTLSAPYPQKKCSMSLPTTRVFPVVEPRKWTRPFLPIPCATIATWTSDSIRSILWLGQWP